MASRIRIPTRRKEAAEILDDAGELPKDALPALMDAAKNANPVVRETVMKAIGKMGLTAEKAVPTLTAALKDAERSCAKERRGFLAAIGPGAKTCHPGDRTNRRRRFGRLRATDLQVGIGQD